MSLRLSQIAKYYPTPSGPLAVLREIDFSLLPGESAAVLGPSGSGKSTLLHLIGTLDAPTSGELRLDETDPFALPERELARFRREKIGFIFQEHFLLPQLTVLENILVPTLAGGDASAAAERGGKLLERVGLGARLDHLPSELSGGERQRAAIARALVHSPRLILADEPTGNLDRANALQIIELLTQLQTSSDAMLIVVTHSQEVADRLQVQYQIDDGRLMAR